VAARPQQISLLNRLEALKRAPGTSLSQRTFTPEPRRKQPDLRGEFRRGLDNGRGVDAGRGIGTAQGDAIRNITGKLHGYHELSNSDLPDVEKGAFYVDRSMGNTNGGVTATRSWGFDASRVVPTAAENRPRNLAYPTHIYAGTPA